MDDPRNTDNAWMETTAFHFHCTEALARRMPLRAGTDAGDVMWLDIDANDPKFANLYASHREWVEDVAATFNQNLVEVIKRKVVATIRCFPTTVVDLRADCPAHAAFPRFTGMGLQRCA